MAKCGAEYGHFVRTKRERKQIKKLKEREIDQLSKRMCRKSEQNFKSNQFGEYLQINASFGLISSSE